jgi:hypothetical protein
LPSRSLSSVARHIPVLRPCLTPSRGPRTE